MKQLLLAIVLAITLMSCTDSDRAALSSYGSPASIKLYNGGVVVAEWTSTGKVATVTSSNGCEFRDAKTGSFIRVSGDVVIEQLQGR